MPLSMPFRVRFRVRLARKQYARSPFLLPESETERKEKHRGYTIFIVSTVFSESGKRGIRTLGALLTHTRFPVVRLRPAQPSFRMVSAVIARPMGQEKSGASDGT